MGMSELHFGQAEPPAAIFDSISSSMKEAVYVFEPD
jgi:hypothetical protein